MEMPDYLSFDPPFPNVDEDATYYPTHMVESNLENMRSEVSVRRPKSKEQLWAFGCALCEPTLSHLSLGGGTGGITDDSVTHNTPTTTSTTNQGIITEKIKSALLRFSTFSSYHFLVQFWAPIRAETGCLQLVTSNQPFALSIHLDERLLKYRNHCLDYKFNLNGPEEHLGIPGRVFHQKWHQCIPDVRYYNSYEYPQLHFVQTFLASFAYPVIQTHPVFQTQDCVGVLEFVSTTDFKDLFEICFEFLTEALEDAHLKCSLCDCFIDCVNRRRDIIYCSSLVDKDLYHRTLAIHDQVYRGTLFEIKEGLKAVCTTHNLPLAQTWVSCVRQVWFVEKPASYVGYDPNYLLKEFRDYCILNELQQGQGFVGRAYLSRKPFFCKDITQFSLTEYPFLPGARKCRFTGCFVICLQSICTKEVDFILEFFFNRENTYGEVPSTFLCSLLETMKLHFRNFKFASGDGKELWMNQEPAPLHNGQETQPTSSTQQEIPPEGDDINNERNAVNAEQINTPGCCPHEAITYEKLEEHFGKKLEDVAQIFGVSRSTFKRICRQNGIGRWPQGKRRRPDPPRSDLPTETPSPPEVRTMTIKATCRDDMIKFQLPLSSRMVDLEEEVSKRLKLAVGTFKIKYTDDDGDRVLIACDEDLQNYMRASNSLGMNTVKMFIEPQPVT